MPLQRWKLVQIAEMLSEVIWGIHIRDAFVKMFKCKICTLW